MRTATSIWSRSVNRLCGISRGNRRLRRSKLRREYAAIYSVYSKADSLEQRALPSATFGAALSVGNDTGTSAANDVATDSAGNSYLTGSFSGTVDFDQAGTHAGDTDLLTARGPQDIFVAKYAPDNSLVWAQRMGGDAIYNTGASTDVGGEIEVDGSGNVYVVGNFAGTGDFGSTTLSAAGNLNDGFVTKLDASGTVQWAKSFGSAARMDLGSGVGVDSAGNVYVLGVQQDVGFGGGADIRKFSSTGSAVWSKSIATNASLPTSSGLAVDASGKVFVAGTFKGAVDFDPGPGQKVISSGFNSDGTANSAGFALKLDTNGKFQWVTPFVGQAGADTSTAGSSSAHDVVLDGSGNVIVGGGYTRSVDFNPDKGITTLPTSGGYITKLNSSGGLVWARALQGGIATQYYGLTGLDVDAAGSIYATGNFSGTVDFDPGAGSDVRTSAGGSDIFVVKLTATGNLGWAETFGGTGDDYGRGIAVDSTGSVHLAGLYENTVDFDPDDVGTYYLTTPGTYANAFRLRLLQA